MIGFLAAGTDIREKNIRMAAALILYIFALGWQTITITFNPRRAVPWTMLIGYLGFISVGLIGALFGMRQSN